MGIMSRYIDSLGSAARDRLIQAQDWCLAEVVGSTGGRCLVGHAEDWRPLAGGAEWWREWSERDTLPTPGEDRDLSVACSPSLFAFRRARPADLAAYRRRIRRWGLSSESRIGARFDRLCIRLGPADAIRLVKSRAGRPFAPADGDRASHRRRAAAVEA